MAESRDRVSGRAPQSAKFPPKGFPHFCAGWRGKSYTKNAAVKPAALLLARDSGLLVLAGLVSHTAAGLAGALAGGLALAAAAVDGALAEVAGFESLYPFHVYTLLFIKVSPKGRDITYKRL